MATQRNKAIKMLDQLREVMEDSTILEEVIYNWMSADDAVECLDNIARHRDIKFRKIDNE